MPARVLIIGLDGFDPDVYRAMRDSGQLPNLAGIEADGFFEPIRSTIPPFTYPAWSTVLTGCNPGKDGIIDFTSRIPHSYDLLPVDSTFRQVPTLFGYLNALGRQVGAMGFPTTYPPEPLNGFMLSGFDSPVAVDADISFCHPGSLYDELASLGSRYTLTGIQEIRIGRRWHRRAREWMLSMIPRRASIAEYLLNRSEYDVIGIVFSESDTAAHHFWAFHDPSSPRFTQAGIEIADTIRDVYRALDGAVGRLVRFADIVLIVSDHGMGGSGTRSISLNRILARHARFTYKTGSSRFSALCRALAPQVFRLTPVMLQEQLFRAFGGRFAARIEARRRLSHARLEQCRAFSDELNYFPSIWLHDGRFPLGTCMDESERRRLLESIRSELMEERIDSADTSLFDGVHIREDLYQGPCSAGFPDLILEVGLDQGYSFGISRETTPGPMIMPIPPAAWIGEKGGSMNGSHRPEGVVFGRGIRRIAGDRRASPGLEDIAPTVLHELEIDIPDWMDGHPVQISSGGTPHSPVDSDRAPHHPTGSRSDPGHSDLIRKLNRLGYL